MATRPHGVSQSPYRRGTGSGPEAWVSGHVCELVTRGVDHVLQLSSKLIERLPLEPADTLPRDSELAFDRLERLLIAAEREAVLDLRRAGVISNDVWYRVTRDLDLEDQRLDS